MGADCAAEGGVVVVVRARERDRRLLRVSRAVVVDEGRCVRCCRTGTARLVRLVGLADGVGERGGLARAADQERVLSEMR